MTPSFESTKAKTSPERWSKIETLLQDGDPRTEILRVCIGGDLQRVQEMLAIDRTLVEIKTETGWSPLRLAAELGYCEIAGTLIDNGAGLAVPESGFKNFPLHLAAEQGHSAMVSLLIKRGANPNAIDINGDAALHYATGREGGDVETVACLLQGGAHPDARDAWDTTCLQDAASYGREELVKLLLKFGADVNARPAARVRSWHENPSVWPPLDDSNYSHPLYGAVCSGSTELVEILLNAGAEINALSFGWSALHAAAAKPDAAMVELLLERGADLFVKSGDGRTPVEMLAGFRRAGELLRT